MLVSFGWIFFKKNYVFTVFYYQIHIFKYVLHRQIHDETSTNFMGIKINACISNTCCIVMWQHHHKLNATRIFFLLLRWFIVLFFSSSPMRNLTREWNKNGRYVTSEIGFSLILHQYNMQWSLNMVHSHFTLCLRARDYTNGYHNTHDMAFRWESRALTTTCSWPLAHVWSGPKLRCFHVTTIIIL